MTWKMRSRLLGLTAVVYLLVGPVVGLAEAVEQTVAGGQAVVQLQQADPVAEQSAPVIAETDTYKLKSDSAQGSGTSVGNASVQMTLGLGAVLLVILGLAWVARRFNLGNLGSASHMKVVSALPVGAKEKILLVEVEGKRLLVGVTAQQISLLQSLEDAPGEPASGDFANRMQALLKAGTLDDK